MPFAQWDKLLYGLARGECILFLGPELAIDMPDGSREVPDRSLAGRLLRELKDEALAEFEPQASDLAWIAQRFLARQDEFGLEMQLGEWHREWQERSSALHDDLAALPFRHIVTTGLDPLMEAALQRAGKTPAVERYHYLGQNEELLPTPSVASPLLFQLYGRVNEPQSVVLTELQVLEFLAHVIAGTPKLPNDLNAALAQGRMFLFLGFGLRQWYLRILFHVLKVLRSTSIGFAVDALEPGAAAETSKRDPAILFYSDNFKTDLVRTDPREFVGELRTRWVASGGPKRLQATGSTGEAPAPPPGAGATVFICHAHEDREEAGRVHDALKRARLEPWLDQQALHGGDRWDDAIEKTIEKVNYFVVLNSKALVAKSHEASYVNKEINRALEAAEMRLGGRFIVPACIDDTPLLDELSKYQAVDLRKPDGLNELVRTFKRQGAA
jgi:hypothetical protein